MPRRLLLALCVALSACSTGEALGPDTLVAETAVPTVPGVGHLPDSVPQVTFNLESEEDDPPVSVVVTRPVDASGAVLDTIAEQVNGNRLLVIGDSVLASTATRYGRELCDGLNPIGWTVDVEAEPGRFVEFGNKVLERLLPVDVKDADDFDAVIVHLGSNYRLDRDEYYDELNEILFRIAPRPTLLLTVTEYRPAWAEVDDVIRELAPLYDNVTVVDWESIARTPGVLSRDGLHPNNQGEDILVAQLAAALGKIGNDGECLSSTFTDDSAVRNGSGSVTGGSSTGGSTSTTGSSTGGSSTTGGTTTGGTTTGGTTTGGTMTGGTTRGSTTGGSSTGGTPTTVGTSTGGTSTGGAPTTVGTTGGGSTTGGSTTGGTTSGTTGGSSGTTGGSSGTTGGSSGTTGGSTGTTGGSTGTTGETGGGGAEGGTT